jgi:hypothetical protein
MDTRAVNAVAPSIDPAKDALLLDKATEEARMGIGFVNVLTMKNPLVFGKYNERPLKDTETNKMLTSFSKHGIQWNKEETALCMIVKRSRLVQQEYAGDWMSPETLREVTFNDKEGLVLASGQHRVAALKKMHENMMDELEGLLNRHASLLGLAAPTEEHVEESDALRGEIGEMKGKVDMLGKWGVIIYDEGKSDRSVYSCANETRSIGARLEHLRMINARMDHI